MPAPSPVNLTPEQIAQFFPDLDPYTRQVLEGYYLDQGNPYTRDLISSIEGDAARAYETSTVPLMRSELNMGGAYGSALGALAESRSAQDYTRGLSGVLAGTRTGLYESERDRMMAALGGYQGQTDASRGALTGMRGQDIGLLQTQEQAAASRFGASASAGAARYGADRQYGLGMNQLRYQYFRDLMNQSSMMNLYGSYGQPAAPAPPPARPGIGVPRPVDPYAGMGDTSAARGARYV